MNACVSVSVQLTILSNYMNIYVGRRSCDFNIKANLDIITSPLLLMQLLVR